MAYDSFDLEKARGDTIRLPFQILSAGAPANIAGCSFWFTGKRSLTDVDGSAIINCTSAGGQITITDAANGKIEVKVPAAQTASLGEATKLYCDLQMKDALSDITTPTTGILRMFLDSTRATS